MTLTNHDLEEMVDWQNGSLSPEIFTNEEIYRRELEKVFGRTWLFLAHDSLIPKPGDFFTTYMGADPVIVARQRDGSVKAMLNSCRHRGMMVCRAEEGNMKQFTCPYHGWVYNLAGELTSAPYEEEVYHGKLDKSKWGLRSIRVEEYKGLYFGNFDDDAPPLVDYLGDFTYYMDTWLDASDGGMEFLPGIIKWRVPGNWKIIAEQSGGDAYHAAVTHASSLGLLMAYDPALENEYGHLVGSRQGHGFAFFSEMAGGKAAGMGPEVTEWLDNRVRKMEEKHGRGRPIGGNFTIFPNFGGLPNLSNEPTTSARTIFRVWHPKGPNEFEAWEFVAVDKSMPQELKDELITRVSFAEGAAGVVEMDDGENWAYVRDILENGYQARKISWNMQMGMGTEVWEHDEYPGHIQNQGFGELPARAIYRRWLEFMTSEEWPVVQSDPRVPEFVERAKERAKASPTVIRDRATWVPETSADA
ncbi:aromatic ring-hydroxylating oxygenase subunit alpha [Microbacterium atlanticum]|uniref:aromatic ring-hydroxylating oxygenase subunit alpha n=1 Tax=Microbacterium atlanticum TaxID=2782168 RepID=UPI001E39A1E1|nr:aromatic ring-hydroxylating dioxygenase subunit alpha [Microbacterium atlanticum]